MEETVTVESNEPALNLDFNAIIETISNGDWTTAAIAVAVVVLPYLLYKYASANIFNTVKDGVDKLDEKLDKIKKK